MSNKQKPKRNKKYVPKPVVRTGIAGLAIAHDLNPSRVDYNKRQSGRYFATLLSGDGVWTPHQMNELISGLNLMERLMMVYGEYVTEQRALTVIGLQEVLQAIRERRERTGKYGVTGDDRTALRAFAVLMDEFLSKVPLARINHCEEIIHRWMKKNPAHRYKNPKLNANVFKDDGSLAHDIDLTLACLKP